MGCGFLHLFTLTAITIVTAGVLHTLCLHNNNLETCAWDFKSGTLDVVLLAVLQCVLHVAVVVYTSKSDIRLLNSCVGKCHGHNNTDGDLTTPLLVAADEGIPLAQLEDVEMAVQRSISLFQLKKAILIGFLFMLDTGIAVSLGIKVVIRHQAASESIWSYTSVSTALLVVQVFLPFAGYFVVSWMLRDVGDTAGRWYPSLHKEHLIKFYAKGTYTGRRLRCDSCRRNATRVSLYLCAECRYGICFQCLKNKQRVLLGDQLDAHGCVSLKSQSDQRMTMAKDSSFSMIDYFRQMSVFVKSRSFQCLLLSACVVLVIQSVAKILIPNMQGHVLGIIAAHRPGGHTNESFPQLVGGDADDDDDHRRFRESMLAFGITSACVGVLGAVQRLLFLILGRKLTCSIRETLFAKILDQDMSFFDDNMTGQLTARLTSDVDVMSAPIRSLINSLLSSATTLFGGLIMCWATSWKLSVLAFTTIGPMIYVTTKYAGWSAGVNREIQAMKGDANAIASEAFGNIRTVRSFSTEKLEVAKYTELIEQSFNKGVKDAFAASTTTGFTTLVDLGASFIILWYGGTVVLSETDNTLNITQLITFQLYWNKVNSAFSNFNNALNNVTRSIGAAQRVLSLINNFEKQSDNNTTRPKPDAKFLSPTTQTKVLPVLDEQHDQHHRDQGTRTQIGLVPFRGDIDFEGVKFAYNMRQNDMVLNGVSFSIKQGETVAVVGHSGGGKSTLVSLLLRLYDVSEGRILLDGVDLRDWDLESYHRNVGVVLQDTQLFARSIEENIAYGLQEDEYTHEELVRVCEKAYAHEFINEFAEGYQTMVGERGTQVSGGQRQRIAIARALLRKPKLILLDEATSALDGESEQIVQRAMNNLIKQGGCTIVMVAHRLSTFQSANKIVVLDHGEVVEVGNHESLMKLKGAYYNLALPQLRSDTETEGAGSLHAR